MNPIHVIRLSNATKFYKGGNDLRIKTTGWKYFQEAHHRNFHIKIQIFHLKIILLLGKVKKFVLPNDDNLTIIPLLRFAKLTYGPGI